jgi:hypothetical protein
MKLGLPVSEDKGLYPADPAYLSDLKIELIRQFRCH